MTLPSISKNNHYVGVSLLVLSAVLFSTVGIFTKVLETEAWGIIFWRGAFSGALIILYLVIRQRLVLEFHNMGWPGFVVSILLGFAVLTMITAFKLTSVANVILIYATVPFLTAGFLWVASGERPKKVTLVASVVALLGATCIVWDTVKTAQFWGVMLCFIMTVLFAVVFVIYHIKPSTPATLPVAVSSGISMILIMVFAPPTVLPGEMPFLALFGLIFAVACVTLFEGSRRLPAPDTALLNLLEVVLAPVLAWLVLSELLSWRTCLGGGLILVGLIWSQVSRRR